MPFPHSKKTTHDRQILNQTQYLRSQSVTRSFCRGRLSKKLWLFALPVILGGLAMGFRYGTIQGVPISIVSRFLLDQSAREAYFSRDADKLHDRLDEMGIEEEIKAFYRPRFKDEVELDWYIHQLLYERTGYIGKAYKLGANQRLILQTRADKRFPRWFKLAQKLGLVRDHYEQNGIIYLIMPDGSTMLYETFALIYPIKYLRQINRRQNKLNQQRLKNQPL